MPKINRSRKRDRKKRVYVSDTHMGAGRSFKPECSCHVYDWLGPKEAKNFMEIKTEKILDFGPIEIVRQLTNGFPVFRPSEPGP